MSPARIAPIAITVLVSCGSSTNGVVSDGGPADARVVDAKTACTGTETVCDPFLSCGCPAADKCTPGASGLGCATAGPKPPGDTCTADDQCDRGSLCAPYAGQTTCLSFCDDVHPCGAGFFCYIVASDLSGHPVAQVCGPTCTLLAQDCTGGFGCYPSDRYTTAERGICLSTGGGHQSDACASMSDCMKGYACIDLDPSGPPGPSCAKMCDRRGGSPTCDQGSTCRQLSGDTQTGVCLP